YSTFFHKDRNGKLRAGPIWDMDLSFGNDLFMWGFDRSKTNLWYFEDQYYNNGSRFWYDLFHNTTYKCYFSKRWNELIQPGQPLHPDSIETFIDQTVALISEAMARDFERWGKLGSHSQRISDIKTFIRARIDWMTINLGSYTACSNVSVPELVITKIMYHPQPTTQFPDDDDLEFLEIRNSSSEIVDLNGVCFLGTGLVYQFPPNSTLAPGLCVVLASNSTAFQSKYGFAPFGQFSRHLSNSSENLVLADAFGNVIDNVMYYDVSPWPVADGNGYYLKLTDLSLDNTLPASWIASNDIITSADDLPFESSLRMYPNPVSDKLYITSDDAIISVSLIDLQGRTLFTAEPGTDSYELNMSGFAKGTYIVSVATKRQTRSSKVVRN
ncbi:MAG TPA: CotH kinase family protein, partial [Bacteroidales bacterium]|nr:CotH kinase family protein [Bacteroidales bacterium]